MIRSIAIDDEPLALQLIRKYAGDTPAIHILDTFTDAFAARNFLKNNQVDLIFLDIQMPDITGIQFFESLHEKPLVIFTTAYSEYAVKGFDLEAADYLIKPIKFERFLKAVGRVEKILSPMQIPVNEPNEHLIVKSEYKTLRIPCRDIFYIEGLDDYVKIYTIQNQRPVLTLLSMKSVLDKLPVGQFMRVHRSFIVPVRLIRSVHNRHIMLENVSIPIGDTYVLPVQRWLHNV
jgi:DNA-binding LytR/AlgR family response regulator